MEKLIDLYIVFLISVISFTGPIIIYLIAFSRKAIVLIKRKTDEEYTTVHDNHFYEYDDYGQKSLRSYTNLIKQTNDRLAKLEKKKKRLIRLMNPKFQIIYLYLLLGISLALILIDILVRSNYNNMYNHILSCSLIAGSLALFIWSIFVLVNILWGIIDINNEINEEESKIVVEPEV